MKGFFNKEQFQTNTSTGRKSHTCIGCGLHKDSERMSIIEQGGMDSKRIMILTADYDDNDSGFPLQGRLGRLLQRYMKTVNIDVKKDCIIVPTNRCKGDANDYNRDCCRKNVLIAVKEYQPHIIIPLGIEALYSLIGHRWKGMLGGIQKWRGWIIPDQELNAWITPIWSLSYMRVRKEFPECDVIYKQDLERIYREAYCIPLRKYPEPKINYIKDLGVINSIKPRTMVAIDYETTGIKPHAKGHRIVCASVAVSENECYVFEMPKSRKAKQPFIDLLANKDIPKIAHNMKYEQAWSEVRLKQPVENWFWDSMIAAHILDNRQGICGLKFQTYVNLGIMGYENEVSPYLTSPDSNSLNNIQQFMKSESGKKAVMKYCALDTIYQYRLTVLQRKQMGYD